LIIILLIFTIVLSLSCEDIGKNYKWQNEINGFNRRIGSLGYDYGWNAASSPFDDGIIITGSQQTYINGQTDLWAIKTDKKGLVEWEKKYGGENDEAGFDVVSTSDGGFIFVGYSWSFGLEQQVYVIKTDFFGNTLWEKTFGGSMWDIAESIIELKSGGFLISGHSNSPGISTGNSDIFLIKIDNNGNKIWQKSYGNLEYPNHEWAYDSVQLPDEGFLIVGGRDRYEEGSKNALILRLNKEGSIMWEKELLSEDNSSELIFSITNNIDGKYYICSTINSPSNPDQYQPKIIKIDIEGNIAWSRVYPTNGKSYHQYRASKTSNGDIILVGTSGREVARGYDEDAFMTRLDSQGNIIWSTPYGSYDNDDWGWSVFETNENNLVLVGSTKSYGASLFDIFLIGTNSNGIAQ
jgi:hypothetical protein